MRIIAVVVTALALLAWFLTQRPEPLPEVQQAHDQLVETDDRRSVADQVDSSPPAATVDDSAPVVRFPNGNEYQIALRNPPDSPWQIELPISDYFQKLKVKAMGGDGAAAHRIFLLLRSCESAYRDSQQLEAAINEMYQTRIMPRGPGSDNPGEHLIDDQRPLADVESQVRQHSQSCETFTDADINAARDWLKLGVDAGDVGAMMDYAQLTMYENSSDNGRPNYPQESVEVLERAWMEGRVHALQELAEIYRLGSEHVAADRVMAHAYLYLNTQLRTIQIERRNPMPEGFQPQSLIAGKKAYLEQHMMLLRPSEVDAAMALAEDLLISNPNCCFDYL